MTANIDLKDPSALRSAALRSFGRRRGRKPSARQAHLFADVLPTVAIDQHNPILDPTKPVWLEIGFGGGEHLVWQAENNPDIHLVGCEPFEDGVVKVLSAIEEKPLRNIHLLADDARTLLKNLPDFHRRQDFYPLSGSMAEAQTSEAPADQHSTPDRPRAHHASRC